MSEQIRRLFKEIYTEYYNEFKHWDKNEIRNLDTANRKIISTLINHFQNSQKEISLIMDADPGPNSIFIRTKQGNSKGLLKLRK